MAKIPYYKVSTAPKRESNLFLAKNPKNRRRVQLIASVLGVYLIAAGLLGTLLFTSTRGPAKADEFGSVSASLKLESDSDLKLGDEVRVTLTLQNTSITDSVNSVFVDFFSTKNSVKWQEALSLNVDDPRPVPVTQNNGFSLPILSSGERAQYTVKGTLNDTQIEDLTIAARVKFLNREGVQEVNTNTISTNLGNKNRNSFKPLRLKMDKSAYTVGQTQRFTLDVTNLNQEIQSNLKGKIFINKLNQSETVTTLDCIVQKGLCVNTLKNLQPGVYSALFMDQSETYTSEILQFQVVGSNQTSFTISDQATLEFPFGSSSINGQVIALGRRIVSQNDTIDANAVCTFEVSTAGKKVREYTAKIEQDRTCKSTIFTSDLGGEGIYMIKLAKTNLEKPVSFINQPVSLLKLEKITNNLQQGQDLEIEYSGVAISSIAPFASSSSSTSSSSSVGGRVSVPYNATVYIYNTQTFELQEVSNINGQNLATSGDRFRAKIPSSFFSQNSTYQLYVKLSNGQQSGFVDVSLSDQQIGNSDSGVIVRDYTQLRVGKNIDLGLSGLTDKSGLKINRGVCQAQIYTSKVNSGSFSVSGQIKEGRCQVQIPAGKITKSGPVLVTFTSGNLENKVIQSRQLQIAPGSITSINDFSLEFEPVRRSYANTLTIGPATDQYGNVAQDSGYTLVIEADGKEVTRIKDIKIDSGFASVPLPASYLDADKVGFKLLDQRNKQLAAKSYFTLESETKLILPNFPSQIKSTDTIKVGISGLEMNKDVKCKLRFVKSKSDYIETEEKYGKETKKCEFNWNLNQFRDNKQALLQFTIDKFKFSKVVDLTASDPANLFVVAPQIRLNQRSEMEINLLTSPIVDKYGLVLDSGQVQWQYNGKIEQTELKRGLTGMAILASRLDTKDIRTSFNQRYLDLDLDVKAGVASISRVNNLSIYLDKKDIANRAVDFRISSGSSYISNYSKVFKFQTPVCRALLISPDLSTRIARSQVIGDECFVQVLGGKGENQIVFEDEGYEFGRFNYTVGTDVEEVKWCKDDTSDTCLIQVLAPVVSKVEATIFDQDKQYKFTSTDLSNTLEINQNGLNPLKKYMVQIKYQNADNQTVIHYQDILGEKLIKK